MADIVIEVEWDEDGNIEFNINGEDVSCDEATELIAQLGYDVDIKATTNIKIGGDDDVGRTESIHRG